MRLLLFDLMFLSGLAAMFAGIWSLCGPAVAVLAAGFLLCVGALWLAWVR